MIALSNRPELRNQRGAVDIRLTLIEEESHRKASCDEVGKAVVSGGILMRRKKCFVE